MERIPLGDPTSTWVELRVSAEQASKHQDVGVDLALFQKRSPSGGAEATGAFARSRRGSGVDISVVCNYRVIGIHVYSRPNHDLNPIALGVPLFRLNPLVQVTFSVAYRRYLMICVWERR